MPIHPGWKPVKDFRDPAHSHARYELSFFDHPELQHGYGPSNDLPVPPEGCVSVWIDPNNHRFLAE